MTKVWGIGERQSDPRFIPASFYECSLPVATAV